MITNVGTAHIEHSSAAARTIAAEKGDLLAGLPADGSGRRQPRRPAG